MNERHWKLLAIGASAVALTSVGANQLYIAADNQPEPEDRQERLQPVPDEAGTCNICGATEGFKEAVGRPREMCRVCESKARHRLLAHFLEHETPIHSEKLEVLHFGPNMGLMARLQKLENLKYATADLYDDRADYVLDVTAIDQPSESWDYIIAYHILEHIVDDQKAMSELYRILRPGGAVILQVPLWPFVTEIYEDATITDESARLFHFGQKDHVRRYSAEGLKQRLEKAGFQVEIIDYLGRFDDATIHEHSFRADFAEIHDQSIWVATKPKDGGADPAAAPPEGAAAAPDGTPAAPPSGDTPAKP